MVLSRLMLNLIVSLLERRLVQVLYISQKNKTQGIFPKGIRSCTGIQGFHSRSWTAFGMRIYDKKRRIYQPESKTWNQTGNGLGK